MWSHVVLVAILAACSALPAEPLVDEKQYPRFIEMSDGDEIRMVDLEEPVDQAALDDIARDPANNQYWLYTRRNPDSPQFLILGEENTILSSNLDFTKPVKVICHGWNSNGHSEPNPTLRTAFLDKADVNVITIDWSRLANRNYATAAAGVPAVGRGLGQFLVYLNEHGVPWTNIHLVGFSLGAHLAGNAGREVSGRVARITALDPAGPLWLYNYERLSPFDAVYVEAIHTDGLVQGIGTSVGNVDFFPNGGTNMPGCLTALCNHQMSWRYFGATITFNHIRGNRCDSLLQLSMDRCTGTVLAMGNDELTKYGTGIYRTTTNANYPY